MSIIKSITVRFDDEMHKKIKVKVATEGTSIQEYVTNLIKADLAKDQQK